MNKIEGVIFDWAGTTVDFGCFAPVNVFVTIFKEAGIEVTMEEARLPMGMLKWDHIKALLDMPRIGELWRELYNREYNNDDVDELYSKFEPMLLQSLKNYAEPIDGVLETVNILRHEGIKIGSTTGYTDIMMDIVTKAAKEKGYEPDFYITPDSTGSLGRPYPYMIYRNMEALKLMLPYTIVKVGDTNSDILEGVNSGVWSVGVVIGSSNMGLSKEEFEALLEDEKDEAIKKVEDGFKEVGADFTIRNISELPELIKKINNLIREGKRPNGKH